MKNLNTHSKMIIGGLVVAAVFFAVGLTYGKKQVSASGPSGRAAFQGGQVGGAGAARGARGGAGGGFVTGKILSKDAESLTVSLMAGGSKIVFLGASTPITKTVSGSGNDLTVGANVVVTGQANTDGSLTARLIELRPSNPQANSNNQ